MAKENQEMQQKPLETWKFWHVVVKYVGVGVTAKMFGVGSRTIYDYAADPAYAAKKGCRDLLERMHHLLRILDDLGGGQYARSAIAYLGTAVEGGLCQIGIEEPRADINDEVLLDYSAVGALHEAVKNGATVHRVEVLKDAAIQEIERTYLRYAADHGVEEN